MSTEAYLRDERFEIHGCAVKINRGETLWYDKIQFEKLTKQIDWSDTCVVCHHAQFDCGILAFHYDVRPKLICCTLAMARLLIGNHVSVSLESVRGFFGLPSKTTPYNIFKNKRWFQLTPWEQRKVAEGAIDEVNSVDLIFQKLVFGDDTRKISPFPQEEYALVDMTIRHFTQPVIVGDTALYADIWREEEAKKGERRRALVEQGFSELADSEHLQSNEKFAELLRRAGVEPEYKTSPTDPEKEIYAFAKTDEFMESLLAGEQGELAQELVAARLGEKSTLLQTRSEIMGWSSARGPMPIYLRYAGTHVLRWSGGDRANWQNMPRGHRIRQGMRAPPGFLFGSVDGSQMHPRIACTISGQWDKVETFRRNESPYLETGESWYGYKVTKKHTPLEYSASKIVYLSAQFGAGAVTLQSRLRTSDPPVLVSLERADEGKMAYRRTHPRVEDAWTYCQKVILPALANGTEMDWGPIHVADHRIWLPNGCPILYDSLEWCPGTQEDEERGWRMRTRKGWTRYWGSKLFQNCLEGQTLVLTPDGWVPIVDVGSRQVWDGEEWVSHLGLVEQGVRETIDFEGVFMTPDHKVMTLHGWVRAAFAKGLYRLPVRLPDGVTGCWFRWQASALGCALRRLRQRINTSWKTNILLSILWVQEKRIDWKKTFSARNVASSRVCCMGFYACSMLDQDTQGLEKLRWSRNNGLRPMARFSKILGRYGRILSNWIDYRSPEQRSRVFQTKLLLGFSQSAGQQQEKYHFYRDSLGAVAFSSSSAQSRIDCIESAPAREQGMASRKMVRRKPVYDLANCGPRRRFVVLGNRGPIIVHNCVIALERVLMGQAMLRIREAGVWIMGNAHDEIWVLIPKGNDQEKILQFCIDEVRRVPSWLPQIPLNAEGEMGEIYEKK